LKRKKPGRWRAVGLGRPWNQGASGHRRQQLEAAIAATGETTAYPQGHRRGSAAHANDAGQSSAPEETIDGEEKAFLQKLTGEPAATAKGVNAGGKSAPPRG